MLDNLGNLWDAIYRRTNDRKIGPGDQVHPGVRGTVNLMLVAECRADNERLRPRDSRN